MVLAEGAELQVNSLRTDNPVIRVALEPGASPRELRLMVSPDPIEGSAVARITFAVTSGQAKPREFTVFVQIQ